MRTDSEDKALFKVGLLSDELTGTFLTLELASLSRHTKSTQALVLNYHLKRHICPKALVFCYINLVLFILLKKKFDFFSF